MMLIQTLVIYNQDMEEFPPLSANPAANYDRDLAQKRGEGGGLPRLRTRAKGIVPGSALCAGHFSTRISTWQFFD